MHGAFRVTGERTVFATPEVGIGFFPDVGATYLLPRLPRRIGAFLALTGLRADAGDLAALGLATSFTPSARLPALADALAEGAEPIAATLQRFAAPPPPSPLVAEADWIEAAFARLDQEAIRAAVERAADAGSALARAARAALAVKSPTSQAIALKQMELGASLDFEQAMTMDFRIASRICLGHDLYEGVRAVIVDKDNAPKWRPAPGEPINPADIDAYFAPLPEAEELVFTDAGP
jgi:enoyl-CoA hydratase